MKKTQLHKCRTALLQLLLLSIVTTSCEEFTDVGIPKTELSAAMVFEERVTAHAAVLDIYAKIRDNGLLTGKVTGMSKELGLYADELAWYGSPTNASASFYNNAALPTNTSVVGWWNNAYSQIYATNAVLEGIAASTALFQADRDQLAAEAKFIRGLLHFYLLQAFGDIPYITVTDYRANSTVSRLPAALVYLHIIEDLHAAAALLPEHYLSSERTRPNASAARALLSRVYLYAGMWDEAVAQSTLVLNNTEDYIWVDDLNAVFLKGSTTTIWQLSPRTASRNTDEGTTFIFNSAPPAAVALSPALMAAFEPGDLRKTNWTRLRSNNSENWYHPYKYKKTGSAAPQEEFSIVLRLAEQYLIRAEARARLGDLDGARNDLDKVRTTAGLTPTEADSQQTLLQAVWNERRVEFFTEYGHRFFDLVRTGQADIILSATKLGWQTTDRLLPLPQAELNLNPNLYPQNPGY